MHQVQTKHKFLHPHKKEHKAVHSHTPSIFLKIKKFSTRKDHPSLLHPLIICDHSKRISKSHITIKREDIYQNTCVRILFYT